MDATRTDVWRRARMMAVAPGTALACDYVVRTPRGLPLLSRYPKSRHLRNRRKQKGVSHVESTTDALREEETP